MEPGPAEMGYRMPAEWERHEGTWISWPKDPGTFPGDTLKAVEGTYVQIVEALGRSEDVRILVDDEKSEKRVRSMLKGEGAFSFHQIRTVDVWVRDYGPIYIVGRDRAVVKWVFNAWGGKYDDLLPDNEAGERIASSTGLKVFRPGKVLEGGSVDVNGKGTLLTTEQCLLNKNRNPGMKKAAIEELLRSNLGLSNVIWLGEGVEGDDTDGHIDDIARFVGPSRVVAAVESDASDRNHQELKENLGRLEEATDEKGRPLEITEVPMPPRLISEFGRLPASHLNFYVGNGAVLVPTFGGRSDAEALRILEGAFPGRETVGIDCRALVHGLGTLHCVTQQVPAPVDSASGGLRLPP